MAAGEIPPERQALLERALGLPGRVDGVEPWPESGTVGGLNGEAGARVQLEDDRAARRIDHDVGADVAQVRAVGGPHRDVEGAVEGGDLDVEHGAPAVRVLGRGPSTQDGE